MKNIMKVTVYTINDCPFCKQEKEYLSSRSLAFEEKNLESNKEYLTEMLAISNNFAGAPVTKIEKDNGQISVLKGFTQEEFDKTLEMGAPAPPSGVAQAQAQMTPPPTTSEPTPPTAPTVEPTPPPVVPTPPPVETPLPPTIPEPPVTEPESTVPQSTPPVTEAQAQMTPPPPLGEAPTTPAAPQADEALSSILNDLQKKVNEIPPQQPQTPPASVA